MFFYCFLSIKEPLSVFVYEINTDDEASGLRLRALLHITRAPSSDRNGNCHLSAKQNTLRVLYWGEYINLLVINAVKDAHIVTQSRTKKREVHGDHLSRFWWWIDGLVNTLSGGSKQSQRIKHGWKRESDLQWTAVTMWKANKWAEHSSQWQRLRDVWDGPIWWSVFGAAVITLTDGHNCK